MLTSNITDPSHNIMVYLIFPLPLYSCTAHRFVATAMRVSSSVEHLLWYYSSMVEGHLVKYATLSFKISNITLVFFFSSSLEVCCWMCESSPCFVAMPAWQVRVESPWSPSMALLYHYVISTAMSDGHTSPFCITHTIANWLEHPYFLTPLCRATILENT